MGVSGVNEEHGDSIALAIGHTVVAAASLEKTLLGEIFRRQIRAGLDISELAAFESLPSGRLLQKLRQQGIDPDLAERINDVLLRRNQMVHGLFEDMDVVRAVVSGEGIDTVLDGVKRIADDCSVLARELQGDLASEIAGQMGVDLPVLARWLVDADLSAVEDSEQRAELERAQELIKLTDWPNPPLYDLGQAEPSEAPRDVTADPRGPGGS